MYPFYYHYYPVSYYYGDYRYQSLSRQQLDPTLFMTSARVSQRLLRDALLIVQKIMNDYNFAKEVMEAARSSQFQKVEELIGSIGIQGDIDIWFNPDGIRFELPSRPGESGKGTLVLSILWQEFPHYV
mgnify:CR=1 FL=1